MTVQGKQQESVRNCVYVRASLYFRLVLITSFWGVLVLGPVLTEGRFPVLVLVADSFPFLVPVVNFFSKFKFHGPGTQ